MRFSIIFAAVAAVVLWGGSPVAAKIAVADLPPLAVAVLRTVAGGVIALPLAIAFGIPFPKDRQQRVLLLLSGFCGFIAFPLLFTIGVALTSANHASMILAALPITTGAIALIWDRLKPELIWWVGCAVAMAGEMILISSTGGVATQASVKGDVIVLASNVFASLGYVTGARLQRDGYPSTGTTFWGVGIWAVLLLPTLPFVMREIAFVDTTANAWIALVYLAIAVTIVGYICWYWALGKGGIAKMGLTQFLQPVSGVVLAAILLSEGINTIFMLASLLVFAGIWIAMKA